MCQSLFGYDTAMDLHISLIDRKDLRGEIYRQLRRAIIDGLLNHGDPLPPTRDLARQLCVSRTTVTVAYDRLAAEGYVSSHVGAGTFVSFQAGATPEATRKPRKKGVLAPRPIWDSVELPLPFQAQAQFNFRTGVPDGSLFPSETWRRLVARELRSGAGSDSGYGHVAGHAGLREAIARHIAVSRGVQASAADLTITNGAQQALDLTARVLVNPGDTVAIEDPGYRPAARLFRSVGAQVIGVPVDDEGLIVASLPARARIVYVTPSHQYPLGVTMSMPRRRSLLAWAERTNSAIIEDDYDSEFRFGERPVEPLHSLDKSGRVIYIGSFSKTMMPSFRLGFVLAPTSLCRAIRKAKHVTDWHTHLLVQGALARFIDDGDFARHVRKIGRVYQARHAMILGILKQDFADFLTIIPSVAGLHITASSHTRSVEEIEAVASRALELGVEVHPLSLFSIDALKRPGIVLGYGGIATGHIDEGLRRLRSCFEA
ncbi:MAG TPA: PLP-dependent aminotransferase family protein [Woeseiaceae bacterium]|nr:PLP-dependent aminotransferase family protein [Woeseiaceae bacterium]